MRVNIALKLALLLASFAMLAAGLTGYYSYATSRRMLIEAAEGAQRTATQVLARRFSAAIEEIAEDAILLARQPLALRIAADPEAAAVAADKELLTGQFVAMLATNAAYVQVRLISAGLHGLEVVRVDRDDDRLVPVIGADLQEKGHYPYVFKTLQLPAGGVHLSEIGINHERGAHAGLGEPSLRVATPIRGEHGEGYGLIVINVELDELFTQLRRDLPARYDVYLANQRGDFLVHPDPAMTFGFDRGRRILIQESYAETAAIVGGSAQSAVAVQDGSDGAHRLATFVQHPYGDLAGNRFVIFGLSQPLDQILADSQALGRSIVQIVIGFSLLAVLLAVATSRAVTGPLKRMAKAVRRFPELDDGLALPTARSDEIGVLARSFRDMQAQIRTHLDELHHHHHALAELASHDPLTGLANRRHFQERLEHAIAGARRGSQPLALLYIDLDNFKIINDVHGHAAGDVVLQTVARRLGRAVREADTVARLGGDEFVVLLEGATQREDVARIADKLLLSLRTPIAEQQREHCVQASIGISFFPQDGDDADTLLSRADRAMYAAKTAGRDRYCFFDTLPA